MESNAARAGVLAALAAVAVVLFIVLSGGDDSGDESTESTESTAEDVTLTTAPAPPPPTASIVIKGGEPVGGVADIEVTKGDDVVIKVGSDEAGEVHVHGYELEEELAAGRSVTFRFTADIEGIFEVELHGADGAHAPLAELTVQPG